MRIVSASEHCVIAELNDTHYTYTFTQSYPRYNELAKHANKLQEFTQTIDTVPEIYDVKQHTVHNTPHISITIQSTNTTPLTNQEKLHWEDYVSIMQTVCKTLQHAHNFNIYHLDIGIHTVTKTTNNDIQIIDWIDSPLTTPTTTPIYISETIPPELIQNTPTTLTQTQLESLESFQLSMFGQQLYQRTETDHLLEKNKLDFEQENPNHHRYMLDFLREVFESR